MKKVLIVFAAVALLASCSSTQDKEAAAELCEHFTIGGDATSLMEILEATNERKAKLTEWQAKYDGKISEGFEEELKSSCPEGHATAEEMGMFE